MKLKNILIATAFILLCNTACFAEYNSKAIKAYNNGIDLTTQEKYKEAMSSFEEAIKIEASFTDAYYNLGIIHQYMNNLDKALQCFETILEYNPKDYDVLNKIAVIYHNKGDKEKAITYIKRIPEDDPNYGLMAELIKSIEADKKAAEEAEKTKEVNEVTDFQIFKSPEALSGFEGPTGMARDSKGNLYVANFSDNSIISIDPKGERKTLVRDGMIKGPIGLAVDKYDNLYVANYESNQIVVLPAYDRTPEILPFIVQKPYFLMVDEANILYVTEQGNNSVSQHKLGLE